MKSRETLPLMDRIHAMTFQAKLGNQRITPQAQSVLRSYRMQLRRAEKFVIDDEVVRLVCSITAESDRDVLAVLSRLPHVPMWLEFDMHVKAKTFAAMGRLMNPLELESIPRDAGYLLYHDGESSSKWIAHSFIGGGNILSTSPGLLTFIFDPEGDAFNPVRGSVTWRSPTLSLRPGFPKIPAAVGLHQGGSYTIPKGSDVNHLEEVLNHGLISGMVDPEHILGGDLVASGDPNNPIKPADWFASSSAAIIDPFWDALLTGTKTAEDINKIGTFEVRENAGMLRWLVTLLAIINGLPRDIRPVQTRPGRLQVGGSMLPYFQHNTINIIVPRDNRVVWAKKTLDREARNSRRAWHKVIGHWRVIERGKKLTHFCRHIPTLVERGVAVCERCEMLIRWINPHERGDPTIGIVDHPQYKVKM
jgi:hypothetical protein